MTIAGEQHDPEPQPTQTQTRVARLRPGLAGLSGGHWLPIILLGLGLLAGILLVRDFGMSTDEYGNATVGKLALNAYAGSQDYFKLGSLKDHGPVYFMLFTATSEAITEVLPGWLLPDGRHLTNYLTFLAGVAAFYLICRRVMRRGAAILATALLATQPVIFGSAFINQKDIPFMALFLGVIALGILAGNAQVAQTDREAATSSDRFKSALSELARQLATEWHNLGRRKQRILVTVSVLAFLLMLDLFVFGSLNRLAESIVVSAYNGQAPPPIQSLYARLATDAYKTSLSKYLLRYDSAFEDFRLGLLAIFTLAGVAILTRVFPSLRELLRGSQWKVRYPTLIAGAVLLGCAVSVRQIGLFAGGLVSMYLLYRGRIRAVLPICLYWAIAAGVTYATWPYLWPDPIGNLILSFKVIPEFGEHNVLFRGENITSATLPWNYLLTLVALDLTEPALVLAAVGVIAWRFVRRTTNHFILGMVALWLIVPVCWQITQRVPLYNNLRHFLFVLPPLFVFAGIGYEWISGLAGRAWLRGLLVVLVLGPGVAGIAWLHPYEYSYFNAYAGGVNGAAGNYDLDYWCTSLKEGAEAANTLASHDDTLQVFGPVQSVAPYAREDLILADRHYPRGEADLVLVCSHRFGRGWWANSYHLVYQVRRGSAVFAEVWQRETPDSDAVLQSLLRVAGGF